jgi:hypothetical protein
MCKNLNTVPKVEGEILALKRFIKDERRAVCIALWHISSSVLTPNFHTTLYQNFGVKNVWGKFSLS